MTAVVDPFALLSAFVLEDGQTWGEVARDFQREDAANIIYEGGPRRHNLLRGRGMSKSTDVAGVALALLLTQAPPRSRSYIYAADTDQAALFMDALAGILGRTPGLIGAVELGARSVTVRKSGATLSVETSDGASAYGTRPWLTVVDELGVWPSTANHRRLWSALVSALPKVPGSRLVVIGTAGSPTGLGARVWEEATDSPDWRAARHPGPSPWWTAAEIAATRRSLTAAEWRRLVECVFAEGDDALTSVEDVDAVIRPGSTVLDPRPGVAYVAGLDVGTRRDLTALAIGHAERRENGRVVVIDRVLSWRPSDGMGGKVDLSEVEASVLRMCRTYSARLRFDRMQAEQLTGNLLRAGVRAEEYVFSGAGANRLARALYGSLRDRALELPDDEELRREFIAARMVETAPGTVKIVNPPGQHDDLVVAVGMVVADLTEKADVGRAAITVPRASAPIKRATRPAEPGELARSVALRTLRQGGDRSSRLGSALFDRRRGAR